jgi:hypothetical protein
MGWGETVDETVRVGETVLLFNSYPYGLVEK